ncbi:hypothetical protein SAMN02745196_02635 [Clostridium collagenovorans DSM 3089]|uniref:Catalase n=1 Tax=Clostridium collagenovorans DSM 3089 TaxID=1121306 RepID=A0A1M5Y3R0_9CLOT|nr:DUF5662 family protein [Clostridium collagenovorans]SHI06710.1 hypothetical protein SAMN02745196_02635 [Clostridium collagenovorans DSM 3089]
MNMINHFKTITNHKLLVMKYCFKVGLYKQGLLHDLSKYKWVEFSAGIKYYKGTVSPNGVQKKVEGYSKAWLHHKGRNKHHFEYWIDYGEKMKDGLVGMKMPTNYVVEMFIDRMSASMNYQKEAYTDRSALEYYEAQREYYVLHEDSKRLLEFLLNMLAEQGEKFTLKYIKEDILKNKDLELLSK